MMILWIQVCQSSIVKVHYFLCQWEGALIALLLAGGRLAGLNQAPRGFAAAVARATVRLTPSQ